MCSSLIVEDIDHQLNAHEMDTVNSSTLSTTSYLISAVFTTCVLFLLCWYTKCNEFYKGIQVVGPTEDGLSPSEAKKKYGQSALSILAEGKQTVRGSAEKDTLLVQIKVICKLKWGQAKGAFQVCTEAGVMIILPSRYLAEIKSDARFGTDDASKKVSITAQ